MAVQRRRSNFVRAKSDRQFHWIGILVQEVAVAANSAVLIGVYNAAALALRPFTIVRERWQVQWNSDQAAVSELPHGAVGATIVSDEALTAGVASIPDPMTNGDAAWHVFQPLIVQLRFLSAIAFQADAGHQYEVDSKAMRKVGSNDGIAIVASNAHATHGAEITLLGRQLVKLH